MAVTTLLAASRLIQLRRCGMIVRYLFASLGAGIFTLVPGRLMHDVIFGTHLSNGVCAVPGEG